VEVMDRTSLWMNGWATGETRRLRYDPDIPILKEAKAEYAKVQ
jgi:hypothetical protein